MPRRVSSPPPRSRDAIAMIQFVLNGSFSPRSLPCQFIPAYRCPWNMKRNPATIAWIARIGDESGNHAVPEPSRLVADPVDPAARSTRWSVVVS